MGKSWDATRPNRKQKHKYKLFMQTKHKRFGAVPLLKNQENKTQEGNQ